MKKNAVCVGACFVTLLLLAGGCDSSTPGENQDAGVDMPVIGPDTTPATPDTRPGVDLPVTPGADARDSVPSVSDSPVTPAVDGPAVGIDGPATGIDVSTAIDAPGLPQPVDGGLVCGNVGDACLSAADCCGLACVGGFCAATSCLSDGTSCTTGGQCCSTICGANGVCMPLNTTCKTAGNTCTSNAECCNGLCNDQHQCAAPGDVSYCAQVGDICRVDVECCMGVCNIVAGAAAGTCAQITTSAACKVDGIRCNGCGDCCSHFCGPYGPGGPKICQPASGCRVQGDLCHRDQDCCGGDVASALPGAGLIKCEPDPIYGNRIGTCGTPRASNCPDPKVYETCNNACNPQGNICHYKTTLVCAGDLTNVRNNCCGCVSGKECCIPDATGIPRCNALEACVPVEGACSSSADCCDQAPCLPDPVTGQLRCGDACVPMDGLCTTNADCCTGLLCHVTPGSLIGVCTIPIPPPSNPDAGAPPTDGGLPAQDGAVSTPDTAPPLTCAVFGQSCSVDLPCCLGAECVNGTFEFCLPSDTDCICYAGE